MGGDLKGVDQKLDYLEVPRRQHDLLQPDLRRRLEPRLRHPGLHKIDPYFGTQKDWDNLVKHADQLGIRIILDGVFNHMSSDSPIFDRYHHYATVGACESTTSPYRIWFYFHDVGAGTGTCAGTGRPEPATYDGWFGFDWIPVLDKTEPDVQAYFLTAPDSDLEALARRRARRGWRMDVTGDPSFPDGYWETFRTVVEEDRTRRADDQRDVAEGQHPAAHAARRPPRHDDELPPARRRDRPARARDFDTKGFADSGRSDQRRRSSRPPRVASARTTPTPPTTR